MKSECPELSFAHSLTWEHTGICDSAAAGNRRHLERSLCVRSSCAPPDTPLACVHRKSEDSFGDLDDFLPHFLGNIFLSLVWNNFRVALGQLLHIAFLS